MKEKKRVNLEKLRIWSDNPRAGLIMTDKSDYTENQIINVLIDVVGEDKMYKLANDIVESKGLLPNVLPVVVFKDDNYYVYDGNRRITCLKILFNPNIIESQSFKNKITDLSHNCFDKDRYKQVEVYVTDETEAYFIMDRTHNGEFGGVGTISWDSYQRDISLAKRNLPTIYDVAYKISVLMGFKAKSDFKNIFYTDINRIFGSKLLKQTFCIEKYEYGELLNIKDAMDALIEYKKIMNIKSFSRYFNIIDSGNEDELDKPMRKFCNWYKETKNNQGKFILKANDIELYEDENFTLDKLEFTIIDENGNQVIWSTLDNEIVINYFTPQGKCVKDVDMKLYGKWGIQFIYKGNEKVCSLKVKPLEKIKIEFENNPYVVKEGNSVDLYSIFKAYGKHGEDISNDIRFELKTIGEMKENVFLGTNKVGQYDIVCTYNNTISKSLTIIVEENVQPIGTSISDRVFVFDSKINITFDYTVCQLISELNNDNFSVEKYPYIFCCSVRSIVELILNYLSSHSIICFSSRELKARIKEMIEYYIKIGISKLCTNFPTVFHSYNNCINSLKAINIENMAAMLNLGAHSSGQSLNVNSLIEVCKKIISQFIVYAEFITKC